MKTQCRQKKKKKKRWNLKVRIVGMLFTNQVMSYSLRPHGLHVGIKIIQLGNKAIKYDNKIIIPANKYQIY